MDVAFFISLTHKNFSPALLLPIPASSLFYGLFNLEMTMVSVLHRELGYKVEKLKYRKVGGHAAGDQNQIQISSWWINHPRSVHAKFYSRDWLIQFIIN